MTGRSNKPSNVKKFEKWRCQPNEHVHIWATGWIGNVMGTGNNKQRNGVLIVTNERVVFYHKSVISEVYESISHDKIASINFTKLLMKNELTIHATGNDIVFKSLQAEATIAMHDALDRAVAGESLEVYCRD